eukprot:GHVS01048008.1.p1 GENE.GHVS01048008.1~~GHVS01048008.1.p1  ORF type:complete len:115 (+),score=10.72 GHVS01048008.1:504-848(+)
MSWRSFGLCIVYVHSPQAVDWPLIRFFEFSTGGCTLLQVADADSTTCGGANASVERSDGNRSDQLRNIGSMAKEERERGKCLFRMKGTIETTNVQQQGRRVDANNSHSSRHARL